MNKQSLIAEIQSILDDGIEDLETQFDLINRQADFEKAGSVLGCPCCVQGTSDDHATDYSGNCTYCLGLDYIPN